ncbi:MAG: thiamine pyrophosphate-binding protein [Chloroflexota bacterium]|nr:thiamine pyrophosphate-binding protein [Chloroflexota bacterium]
MAIKTGGEAVVEALMAQGIDTLFGLPGIQNDWLYNALFDNRDKIKVIHTRHEQGASYMALGYAQATGKPAVFNVVPGPGILNASAGLATAYSLNAKVLCLAGQIDSANIGKGKGDLHEIPQQSEILRGLSKWSDLVLHPADAGRKLAQAFYEMNSGRPRPVALEVPPDILKMRAEVPDNAPIWQPFHPPVDSGAIETAGKWLGQAKHPMIFVGGGAQGVSTAVTQLAIRLQAPVVAYRTGHGVLDSRHYLSLKNPESHEYYKKTDLVLAVGTHMRLPLSRWGSDEDMKVIRIDVDNDAMRRIQKPDLPIVARAEDALPPLLNAVDKFNRKRESRETEMLDLKAKWREAIAFLEPQNTYLKILREELDEDGIFVDELTQVGYAARISFPVYKPRSFISSGYQGTLGYGFPTALGAKVAKPDAPVLSIAGDGGFMFTVGELATAVQHQIPLVTVVFNNDAYGNVRAMQIRDYDERVIATDLLNPDFVKLAESFGAKAFRAETEAELRRALRYGFASDLPTLIDVPIGETPSMDRLRDQGRIRPPRQE